jgi:hypothetical protein
MIQTHFSLLFLGCDDVSMGDASLLSEKSVQSGAGIPSHTNILRFNSNRFYDSEL